MRLAQPNGKEIRGAWHPVVGVAEGSQANYPEPDEARAPNWARCAGIPSDKASAATFAYNVRDQTGESRALALPDSGLELVSERSDVMGFPGYWGANASATFETKLGKEYPLQQGGRGPAGTAVSGVMGRAARADLLRGDVGIRRRPGLRELPRAAQTDARGG